MKTGLILTGNPGRAALRAMTGLVTGVIVVFGAASGLSAQAEGVAIESRRPLSSSPEVLASAAQLREQHADKLMDIEEVVEGLAEPTAERIELPKLRTKPLPPKVIARVARRAKVRIGWYYLCHRCDNWHLKLSGGYAVGDCGVVAGCYHSVDPSDQDNMREAYLVALDADLKMRAVTAVLAADKTMDTVLLRVEDAGFTALALNDQTCPGERAFLLSDPLNRTGYFSAGMINRFYWQRPGGGHDANQLAKAGHLRMNVSTDWAPGSSGAGVLDDRGNVIGHVATISPLRERPPGSDNDRFDGAVLITLHEAIPARCVRLLIEDCQASAGTAGAETE